MKEIPGFIGYFADIKGRIYKESWDHKIKIVPGSVTKRGYLKCYIGDKQYQVHRLITVTFLNMDLESKLHVHHIDGNMENNRLRNLKVMSALEHAYIHCLMRLRSTNTVTIQGNYYEC